MPRPSTALITRDGAVTTALEIIDTEGLDALSLPRLGRALNVSGAALYHHFTDKSELLSEIARAVFLETRLPTKRPRDEWQDFFVALALNFRQVVLRHRNTVPLLLQYLPRDILTQYYEHCAGILVEAGIPESSHVLVLDGLDTLVLGSVLPEALRTPPADRPFVGIDRATFPTLDRALDASHPTSRQLLDAKIRTFLSGVVDRAAEAST